MSRMISIFSRVLLTLLAMSQPLCAGARRGATYHSLPRGAGAWVYDAAGGEPAEWAADIAKFNARARTPIRTVFSYGGDMELYLGTQNPFQTYFPPANQAAAVAYSATPGVESVVLVVDGRMDGGESYSPDLTKLTSAQIVEWAGLTAELYCAVDAVAGIQIDLEPSTGKYRAPLVTFIGALATALRSRERDCVNPSHPAGRAISVFMFAPAVDAAMWAALGPNGFVSVSGYDLSSAPAGVPSTPAFFRSQLGSSLAAAAAGAAANNGSYLVGIPAAASAHEFETFTLANGTVITGFPQLDYATSAVQALAAGAAGRQGYLGPALWGFAPNMAHPPGSKNLFEPSMPFSALGEEDYLATSL